MKPKSKLLHFLVIAGSSLMAVTSAHASTLYWDGGTIDIAGNGNGASGGTAGTWDTTIKNWDAGASPYVAWNNSNNDTAVFAGTAGTVTLGTGITAGGLTFNTTGYTITGNTLTLTGSATISAGVTTSTISSDITGTAGLQKTGAGRLILSGTNNTYSGTTTLSAGTLQGYYGGTSLNPVSPFGTSSILLNGGTLELYASGTVNATAETVNFGNNVSVGADATIYVNRVGGTSSNKTMGLGTLTIGANTLYGTAANVSYSAGFTAVSMTGNATFSPGQYSTLVLGAITQSGGSYSLTKTGVGTLRLTGTNDYSGGTILNGGTLSVSSNASLGASGTGITVSGSTTLNSLATAGTEYNRAISLGTGTTLTLTHAGGNTADFSGAITGSGNLTATLGTTGSTIALSNTGNTFTGDVLINTPGNGNLKLSFNSIGDAGKLSLGKNSYTLYMQYTGSSDLVLNTRRIDLNSSFGSVNDGGGNPINMFESNGTGTVKFNAGMTVAASKTGTFFFGGTNTGNNTYAGVIPNSTGGTLSIGKHGAGKWILSNDNTFTGGVEVRAGTLVLSGTNSYTGQTNVLNGTLVISSIANYNTSSSIGAASSGAIILGNASSTGTLLYTGAAAETDRTFQINSTNNNNGGGAAIINNGTGSLTFKAATFNNTYTNANSVTRTLTLGGTNGGTIEGAIVNNSATNLVGLTKMGTGTWTLTATSSYTGTTTVNGGILELKDAGTGRTQSYTGLTFGLSDGTLTSNRAGSGTFSTTFTTLTRSAGATGNFISTGGTNGSTNIVNTTGAAGYMGKGLYYNNSDIAWREGTNGYVRSINYGVDSGTSAVGTVLTNTHMKFTSSVTRSGTLELSSLHLAGDGVNWTNSTGVSNINGSLIKSGGGTSIISGAGTVGVNSNAELVIHTVASNDILEISSQMVTFGTGLTKSGAGTLVLSNAGNTFNAPIFVNAGTLSVGANIHLGSQTGGQTVHLRGGTLQATGTFGLFNGTAGTNNRNVTLANQSGIEVTDTNTLTIAGVISNNTTFGNVDPGFNKTGTGTLQLTGANTFTGATNVSQGTLAIGTGGSINSSSGITIGSGAHFKYNSSTALTTGITNNGGRISGSGNIGVAVALNSTSDIISPGNSPGFQPYGVGQTWSSFTYEWETNNFTGTTAGTDFDQITITGALSLTGAAAGSYILDLISLNALNAAGTVPNFSETTRSWDILTATGGITGFNASYWTIDASTGPNIFTSSPAWGGTWSLSLNDTAGTDSLVLTYTAAVPEPGAALIGSLGLLALLRRRR